MYARLTLLEIDTMRVATEDAVRLFEDEVLPTLRSQPGYAGVLVMATPLGGGALVSFWETEEAAEANVSTGFYSEVLEKYMTIFTSPPGRERYEVAFAELPAAAPS